MSLMLDIIGLYVNCLTKGWSNANTSIAVWYHRAEKEEAWVGNEVYPPKDVDGPSPLWRGYWY
jgi:hypothetical protein